MTQTEITTEKDFLISLTLHNFSAEMIKEFARKIAKPYFAGNLNQALRTLMENAINEETITNKARMKEPRIASNEFR
jgi:hypothetical protein